MDIPLSDPRPYQFEHVVGICYPLLSLCGVLDGLQRATDATMTPRSGFYTLGILHQLPVATAVAAAAATARQPQQLQMLSLFVAIFNATFPQHHLPH